MRRTEFLKELHQSFRKIGQLCKEEALLGGEEGVLLESLTAAQLNLFDAYLVITHLGDTLSEEQKIVLLERI